MIIGNMYFQCFLHKSLQIWIFFLFWKVEYHLIYIFITNMICIFFLIWAKNLLITISMNQILIQCSTFMYHFYFLFYLTIIVVYFLNGFGPHFGLESKKTSENELWLWFCQRTWQGNHELVQRIKSIKKDGEMKIFV